MRIAHVIPSIASNTGGAPTAVVNIALASEHASLETVIYASDSATAPQATIRKGGVQVKDMPPGASSLDIRTFPTQSPTRFSFSPALWSALHADISSYDVVHIHSLFLFPQWAAWRAATKGGVPHVVSIHGALDPYLQQRGQFRKAVMERVWQRRMLDNAATIHVTSNEECQVVTNLGFRSVKAVIPIPIHLPGVSSATSRSTVRAGLEISEDDLVIINHGRIARKKGLDILVEATARLRTSGVEAHLILVGPDEEGLGDELRALAGSLGIAGQVHLLGARTGSELADTLVAGDIWALPSHSENFGLAVVEALSLGMAVVTSPHVNIAREAQQQGALCIAPNTAEGFQGAIRRLFEQGGERETIRSKAMMFAEQYSISGLSEQYRDFYEQTTTERLTS